MVDDDRELIARCVAHDQDACAALVEAYARLVGTVIWRAVGDRDVVEDLVQETFYRAFRRLADFRSDAKLSTWLCTIAHHVSIDHHRRVGRWRGDWLLSLDDPDAPTPDPPAAGADPESAAAQRQVHRVVRAALVTLPEKYRTPLLYAAIEGQDYESIATVLGVPVGTVKTLVFRGRRLLRERVLSTLGIREDAAKVSDAL